MKDIDHLNFVLKIVQQYFDEYINQMFLVVLLSLPMDIYVHNVLLDDMQFYFDNIHRLHMILIIVQPLHVDNVLHIELLYTHQHDHMHLDLTFVNYYCFMK